MKHLKTFETFLSEREKDAANITSEEETEVEEPETDETETEETEEIDDSLDSDVEIPEDLDIEEGNKFVYAAGKAKAEGKKEFEFEGKKYPVTIKDTGIKK